MLSAILWAALAQDPKTQEELEKLEERVEKRLQELDRKLEDVNKAAAKNAFNPQITVFGNYAMRSDSKRVLFDPGGPDEIRVDDRAYFRGGEFDFRAAIDPYADGVIIVAVEGSPDGEFETHIEEGYALLKKIPLLEVDGVKLKLGVFRPAFGVSNKLHLHDMPHTTRPLVIERYLGSEHGSFFEAGFAPMGAEFNFFVPGLGDTITVDVFIDVLQAGGMALTEDNDAEQPALMAHVDVFYRFGPSTTLNVGVSHYGERGGFSTSLTGVDVTFMWRPDAFRSVIVGGEIMRADREFDDGGGPMETEPTGWYAYVQVQLSASIYVGSRYDHVEDISNDGLETSIVGAYVSYYTSEFFRIRIGFERRTGDLPEDDDLDTVMLEFNIVFGSHPIEPYWVNR